MPVCEMMEGCASQGRRFEWSYCSPGWLKACGGVARMRHERRARNVRSDENVHLGGCSQSIILLILSTLCTEKQTKYEKYEQTNDTFHTLKGF